MREREREREWRIVDEPAEAFAQLLAPKRFLQTYRDDTSENWSCAVSPLQRSLHSTLGCFPTTAGSAQFCLLCCQPEPVPESLPARPPPLTRGCPCRLPVWSGQSIHMVHRTYIGPRHSISQTPFRGTERCDPPQIQPLDHQNVDNIIKHKWSRKGAKGGHGAAGHALMVHGGHALMVVTR